MQPASYSVTKVQCKPSQYWTTDINNWMTPDVHCWYSLVCPHAATDFPQEAETHAIHHDCGKAKTRLDESRTSVERACPTAACQSFGPKEEHKVTQHSTASDHKAHPPSAACDTLDPSLVSLVHMALICTINGNLQTCCPAAATTNVKHKPPSHPWSHAVQSLSVVKLLSSVFRL